VYGEEIGTAVRICKCDRDRNLALHRRVCSLELVYFNDSLVRYELNETPVIRISVRTCLTRSGRPVACEGDPECATLAAL
jgi:hypothetical protein